MERSSTKPWPRTVGGEIVFTRARVNHKDDQAWIKRKIGAVICRMVGHSQFSELVAGQTLAQLHKIIRLHLNFFQPSFKLRERVRDGSKIKKFYHAPATLCDRLLTRLGISQGIKGILCALQRLLNPVCLLHRIRQGQSALTTLSNGQPVDEPLQDDLNKFLSKLPES
jgi:hypothetical protein